MLLSRIISLLICGGSLRSVGLMIHYPASPDIVMQAITSGNSLAAGPDDLTLHSPQNLGPLGLQYLTHIFNLQSKTQL